MTNLNRNSCQSQLIHIPESIQPHGVLLTLTSNLRIVRASKNADLVLSVAADRALGQSLQNVLPERSRSTLIEHLSHTIAESSATSQHHTRYGTFLAPDAEYVWACHFVGDELVLEFEPQWAQTTASERSFYHRLAADIERHRNHAQIEPLLQSLAVVVREMTQFDRALVYRFDESFNGCVVAESRNENLPSYLGLHFPESDIPTQARELYLLNRVRHIVDGAYVPVPLLTDPSRSVRPLDMSRSMLRSVAPVHRKYMQNMNTAASLSVSIIVEGQLWGLVSCHHHEPRHVALDLRNSCDIATQIFAAELAAILRGIAAEEFRVAIHLQSKLTSRLESAESVVVGLTANSEAMLALLGATGGAVIDGERYFAFKDAPNEAQSRLIARWVAASGQGKVVSTDSLSTVLPELADLAPRVSGVLGFVISEEHGIHVLWFRPEQVEEVVWAGRPLKDENEETGRISPRKSFEAWCETVRGRARRWDNVTENAAEELRSTLLSLELRRAELRELKRVNLELDAFSYTVAHDLEGPLRQVRMLVEMAKNEEGEHESNGETLRYIDDIVSRAGKFVSSLLELSRSGSGKLRRVRVDMDEVFRTAVAQLTLENQGRSATWRIAKLPPVYGDEDLLRQAAMNLLTNALKYTRKRTRAEIEVGAIIEKEKFDTTSETMVWVSMRPTPARCSSRLCGFMLENTRGVEWAWRT